MEESNCKINFDFFSIERCYETELKSKSKIKNFLINDEDQNKKEYFFYENDETLTYFNEYKNMKKTFNLFGDKNKLNNLFLISNNKSLVLLFESIDLFIIPIKYIQNDSFDLHWEKISNVYKIPVIGFETESARNFRIYEEFTKLTTTPSFNHDKTKLNLTNFLICTRKKFQNEEFSQKLKKNYYIFYRNIFNSYIAINNKHFSPDLTNTTVIHWTDSSGIISEEITEFLIMNVDYYILIINLTNLECVKYFFYLGECHQIQQSNT